MSTPKVIAIAFLGMFLSLALVFFGFLFTLNMTILNANFVTSRLDDLPVSSLVEEAELGKINEENPELADFIEGIIIENEPELKERAGEAIHIVYDYLEGRSQSLDLERILRDTILDPDFAVSMIEEADLAPLAEELVETMIPEEGLPQDFSIEPYLDDIAVALEPWLKEQADDVIPPIYDYILGQSQSLDLVISLEPAEEIMKSALKEAFLESPPPEMSGLSQAELRQEFDEYYSKFEDEIPSGIEIDLDALETPDQMAKSLAEAEEALAEARRYIGYFNLGYGLLIGFIVLLIAGIIFIYREVKGATRILGITFLVYSIFGLIAVFVTRGVAGSQIAQLDIPASLQTWLTQLINSSLTPLLILTIILMVVGAVLLTVSFIYRRRQTATETETPL